MLGLLIGMPNGAEWFIIVGAIVLLFGATKVPQLMRGMGQGIKEFKQAVREDEPKAPAKEAAEGPKE